MRLIMTYEEDATVIRMKKIYMYISLGNRDDGISGCKIKPPLVLKMFQ